MKILIVFLLFSLLNNTDNLNVSILPQKEEFSVKEKLTIRVLNKTQKKYYFTIGIDYFYKQRWVEIISDIENPFKKLTKINNISPSDSSFFHFDLENLSKWNEVERQYRIKINYGEDLNHLDNESRSERFTIK